MSKTDGGPAFPAMHFDLTDNEHGMTLRDYFAAKASGSDVESIVYRTISDVTMAAMVGRPRPVKPEKLQRGLTDFDLTKQYQTDLLAWECDAMAAVRYAIADAMLKAREAK